MRAVLLGTAAGGGFPQWNCACRMCAACRRGDVNIPPRTQDCLAVSADGAGWLLVNASPDIRSQILACPRLAAGPAERETPLRGALLTDAELDHALGLLMLREGAGLRVWAPAAALEALRDGFPVKGVVSGYGGWRWREPETEIEGLRVSTFAVGDKRPKYARDSTAAGPWVVAYRIADPATGGSLVYAPCLATWPDGFDEFVAGADVCLADGTFYSADEMPGTGTGVASGAQKAMGHIPIAGETGSLARMRRRPEVRWMYTHFNNTNPVLDAKSRQHAEVVEAGVALPRDGLELEL
ncbi:MAG: pyrroloquinoline quinone biosynthesis protein PqqB [Stackebrandtia sp.]